MSINDLCKFGLSFSNKTRPINKIIYLTALDTFSIPIEPSLEKTHIQSLRLNSIGKSKIKIEVYDTGGGFTADSTFINVIPDIPVADAGKDTTAGLNDPVFLHGSAVQRFGKITKWEWSIDGMPFVVTSKSDTVVRTPSSEKDRMVCILRVTDDDDLIGTDTVNIRVISNRPSVRIIGDSTTGMFDSIHLHIRGKDNGTIVRYEWDIGAKGTFFKAGKTDTVIEPVRKPDSTIKVVVKATDDDSESSFDTLIVKVCPLWKNLQPSSKMPGRNGYSLQEFKNSLWILGGSRYDIWNSSDGLHWNKVIDTAPFGLRFGHSAIVFNGKLFVIGGKGESDSFPADIWSSHDGKRWHRDTIAPFLQRYYQGATIHDNKLWISGGIFKSEIKPVQNDIWYSVNGKEWFRVADSTQFSPRYGHGFISFHDKLYVSGGLYDGVSPSVQFKDLWESTNGITWVKQKIPLPFYKSSTYYSFFIYDNRIWSIGGYNQQGTAAGVFSNLAYSDDGIQWKIARTGNQRGESIALPVTIFKNKVIVCPDVNNFYIMQ